LGGLDRVQLRGYEREERKDGRYTLGKTHGQDSREAPPTLPILDVVIILPDGRKAAKIGGTYYLLKR